MTTLNNCPGEAFKLPGVIVTDLDNLPDRTVLTAHTAYGIPELCPKCSVKLHKHSAKVVLLQHTPMNGKPTVVELTKERKRCPVCKQVYSCDSLPCAAEGHNVSKALLDHMIKMGFDTTFLHIEKYCGVSDSTAQRVLEDYFEEMDRTHKFELPYSLGLDEVMIGGKFRTTVTNLQQRTLVDFLEERSGNFLVRRFKSKYSENERMNVRWVCTDMYRPFEKPLHDLFPNAEWVIDHFHVVRMANEVVDGIRRNLQKQLADPKLAKGIKKRLRYVLLAREKDLSLEDRLKLEAIGLVVPDLKVAYGVKEDFYNIYESGSRADAEQAFKNWKTNIPHGGLFDGFRDLAKTVHNFHDPILRYWDSNGLTNGYTECANGLARVIDRKARGLRFDLLRGKLLYSPKALRAGTTNSGKEYGAKIRFVSLDTGEITDTKPDDDDSAVEMAV